MTPQRDMVPVREPARGHKGACVLKPVACALGGQQVNPKLVSWVRARDGQLQLIGQCRDCASMVNVRMGDPNLTEMQAVLFDSAQQVLHITSGVNQGRLQRFGAPDQGAVLLKGGDRNGFVVQHEGDP